MSELTWQEYTEIADNFQHKVKYEDRQDLKQDIILRLAEIASIKTEPLTLPTMLRVASFVTIEYWRNLKRQPIIFSLNETVEDDDGNSVELSETLADDKAIDLEAWVDAKTWLHGCPRRLVKIACKKIKGKPLLPKELTYLCRYRQEELKKHQQKLL
jgi:hypothetical protein